METYSGSEGKKITQIAFLTFTFPTYMDVPESFMRAALMVEQMVNTITGGQLPDGLEIPYLGFVLSDIEQTSIRLKELMPGRCDPKVKHAYNCITKPLKERKGHKPKSR